METGEKRFTIGEMASLIGLTVRTLQHYDNIGLLPVSGRTEGGRRYYTEYDLIKLEQIAFYKSIGVSLDEIKKRLEDTPNLDTLEGILNEHLGSLIQQIDTLHLTMAVAESTLEIVKEGELPPWKMMTGLIRSFSEGSLMDWEGFAFDDKLLEKLKMRGLTQSHTAAMDFYHSLKQMMIDAATLSQTDCAPDAPAAQSLAKRWWDMILEMTGGDNETTQAFMNVNENRDSWPEHDRKLFETGEKFLEAALGVYIVANQIEVPEAFLKQEGWSQL